MMIKYTNKISVQLNFNTMKSIDINEDAYVTNSTDGCQFNIVKLKPIHKLEQTGLLISIING